VIHADEFLEQRIHVMLFYSDAGVGDGQAQDQAVRAVVRRSGVHRQRHRSSFRVLRRVDQKIRDDLTDTREIPAQLRRHVRVGQNREIEPPLPGLLFSD
jgi:hypothetical protein